MKNQKKGFTLTELLIALGVIGMIVAILVPIIFNLIPDQSVLMAKRAYYSIQTVVSDLINDEGCYPDKKHNLQEQTEELALMMVMAMQIA